MDKTDRMRAFLVKFAYITVWALLIIGLLKYALPYLLPFVLAFIIAFILKPIINKVADKTRLSRKQAAIGVLTLLYLLIVGLLALLGINLIVYAAEWLSGLPEYYSRSVKPVFDTQWNSFERILAGLDPSLVNFFSTAGDSISSAVSNLLSGVSSGAITFASGVATKVPLFIVVLFLTIIASYFLVVDYYKVSNFIARQFSEEGRRLLFVIKKCVVDTLLSFARAYGIIMSITFVEMSVGLLILGVNNALLIALVTAVVDIVPVFGTGTILIPWAIYSLFSGNLKMAIGLAIIYGVITAVRQIIEPRIVGKQIGLYPLLTLICMFIGARLFGLWGLFGFPITITVLIHLNRSGEIKLYKN